MCIPFADSAKVNEGRMPVGGPSRVGRVEIPTTLFSTDMSRRGTRRLGRKYPNANRFVGQRIRHQHRIPTGPQRNRQASCMSAAST